MRWILIVAFALLGLWFVIGGPREGFDAGNAACPNVLIQDGCKFYLYNSSKVKVPGVNPIVFDSLQDYTQFIEWQNAVGITCPVLKVQKQFNTQGGTTYVPRPSAADYEAARPSPPPPCPFASEDCQSKNLRFDHTPVAEKTSPDATSADWIGQTATRDEVDKGQFAGDSRKGMDRLPVQLTAMRSGIQDREQPYADAMSDTWKGTEESTRAVNDGVYKDNNVSIWVGSD